MKINLNFVLKVTDTNKLLFKLKKIRTHYQSFCFKRDIKRYEEITDSGFLCVKIGM